MHHGFVPTYNPFDCVDVQLPELVGSKRELAMEFGVNTAPSVCVGPNGKVR